MQDFDLTLVLPVVILASYGLLSLMLAPFLRGRSRILGGVSLLGIVMATASTARLWQEWSQNGPLTTAHGMVRLDGFGLFMSFILLIVGALTFVVSPWVLERDHADHGEFYALVLFALAGMITMVHTTHLIVVLVGLEVFSLALYVLCGLTRSRLESVESALKYFLLGAFSSGFLVYGLALLYGAVGSLDMTGIGQVATTRPTPLLWTGMGLVLIGLAFKIAVVPFHHWVPDVYQGAPTNVTGFMAAATKVAAFATMLRFLVGAFGEQSLAWIPLVTVLAVLTMTVANLVALAQNNIKRLLAFSSIAHAGTLLIGFACDPRAGVPAILFYLTGYAFMTVGAFAVAAVVGRGDSWSEAGYDLASWTGLGRRNPALATAMTVFLLSLAGLPPTVGFLGKYLIFEAAVESKQYFLAIAGVLNAVVAAYYYIRVVLSMWMEETETAQDVPIPAATAAALIVAVLAVFYLGIAPQRVLQMAQGLAASLL